MLELNFTNTLKTFSCDIFRSLDLISEMMKDPQTLQFIQDCKQQLNHFFPLSEFLHRPIQRILKYPLLLRVRNTFLSVLITSAVSSNDNQLLWSLSKNVYSFPIVPISCYRQTGSLLKTFFMLLVVLVGFLLIFYEGVMHHTIPLFCNLQEYHWLATTMLLLWSYGYVTNALNISWSKCGVSSASLFQPAQQAPAQQAPATTYMSIQFK